MSTSTRSVLRGRRLAEQLMTSTCTVVRRGATTGRVYDHATMTYTEPASSTVYSGKCRVKGTARFDHVVDAGEQPVTLHRFTVAIPVTAVQLEVDDIITITASELDPALPGLVLRVREPEWGDQITARRAAVEVNSE